MTEPAVKPASPALAADLIARVERTAEALYEDEMGSGWPIPYSTLKCSDQERWRGAAYNAAYALARCPVTGEVHPWLRSWCEPTCQNTHYPAAEDGQ